MKKFLSAVALIAGLFVSSVNAATTQPTLRIISPGADSVSSSLRAGETIEFSAGTFTDTKLINLPSNAILRGAAATQPTVISKSLNSAYGTDFVVASGTGESISNLAINSQGNKTAQAINVHGGKSVTISNVRQTGVGKVLRFDGAVGLRADLLYANTGSIGEYGIGAFDGGAGLFSSQDCWIYRFDLLCINGVHCLRVEHSVGLHLGHPTLRLPELASQPGPYGKGFAARSVFRNPVFGGCALAVNDGSGLLIERILVDGKLGIGPIHIWAAPHPDWRMVNPVIKDCQITGPIVFNLGTVNALVKDCHVASVQTDADRLYDSKGKPIVTFPNTSGKFDHCLIDTLPPMNANWTYVNCTSGGKPVGLHGGR